MKKLTIAAVVVILVIVGIIALNAVTTSNQGAAPAVTSGADANYPTEDNYFKINGALTFGTGASATINSQATLTVNGTSTLATTTATTFTEGGRVYSTTTTAATETISGSVLLNNNVIRFLGTTFAEAMTATIAATSTWPSTLLPNAGDTRSWVIENGYTAAATTTTVAAGAGIDLQEPDGQNVVIGINNYAWLTCFREVSTDVVCRVDETIPAD